MSVSEQPVFRLRSFVLRGGRGTSGQIRAMRELWPAMGLATAKGQLDYADVFGRVAPTYLEIGFGSGQTLLAAASTYPEKNFIGVETHRPGLGALLMGVRELGLTNIRVFQADVIDVLAASIPLSSLAGVQIFFPDPWQKRRHYARRLIQPSFLQTMAAVLQSGGSLHLATDWDDYARQMMQVVSADRQFVNEAGVGQFGGRSCFRPTVSKFESRALDEGRVIQEIQLIRL